MEREHASECMVDEVGYPIDRSVARQGVRCLLNPSRDVCTPVPVHQAQAPDQKFASFPNSGVSDSRKRRVDCTCPFHF